MKYAGKLELLNPLAFNFYQSKTARFKDESEDWNRSTNMNFI